MSDNRDNYTEETKPLFRLLRTEAFRFIIVRYNHYSIVNQLKEDLLQHFPDRPQKTVDARKTNYRLLVDTYYKAGKGFFFIENFDEVLANPEIYSGLNQRRDKLAMSPIALIVFISSSSDELFARQIMEKMPDLWSFRSLLLDLKADFGENKSWVKEIAPEYITSGEKTIGGISKAEKELELNRLQTRVALISETETEFLRIAFEQIAKLLHSLNKYDEAIKYLHNLEKIQLQIDDQIGLGTTYNDLGLIYSQKGEYKIALEFYNKSLAIRVRLDNNAALGTTYNNIGGFFDESGNKEEALSYYQKAEKMFLSSNYKNGLGATYNNIGGYYIFKENWTKALEFLFRSETVRREIEDSEGLGITYFNIGFVYSKLGFWKESLEYLLKSEKIFIEIGDLIKRKELQKSVGNVYNSMGLAYSNKGDFNTAINYHHQAERIRYEIRDYSGLVQTLYNIGMEWLRIKNAEKAVDYFILAGYIAKKNSLDFELKQMDWALKEIVKKHGKKNFMKMGESHYKSWLEHAEIERKSRK